MADKFLDFADMEGVKEAVRMTRLGQLLLEERIGLPLETVRKLKKEKDR